MKRLFSISLLLGLLLILSFGCTHTYGDKKIANKGLISNIKVGASTKQDVRELFGEPTKVTFISSGEEIWDYMYTRTDIRKTSFIPYVGLFLGGADTKNNTLTIKFKDFIVKAVGIGKTTGAGGGLQDFNK